MHLVWNWPQIAWAALVVFQLCIAAACHGEAKSGKHSFPLTLMSAAIIAWIIYEGGFWSGASPT